MAFVEDDAVAGFEGVAGGIEFDEEAGGEDFGNGPDARATGFGETGGDECLVIDAGKEAVGEAAGKVVPSPRGFAA